MAIVEPMLHGIDQSNRFADDEISTVETLAKELPDTCTVFHSVNWINLTDKQAQVGEVDICVVAPSGLVVMIEQKNGVVKVNSGGVIHKSYALGKRSMPAAQLSRSRNALVKLWQKSYPNNPLELFPLIYLPDHTLSPNDASAIDKDLVVDASKKQQLSKKVYHLLKLNSRKANDEQACRVIQFLRNELSITPNIDALLLRQQNFYHKQQSNIANVIHSLHFEPKHLLIEGGAGSGKTQIAVDLFQQAINSQKRPLMLCYNRPLADDLEALAENTPGIITNIDRFADHYMRTRAIYDPAEESNINLFSELRLLALAEPVSDDWLFDVLIIDEAQDFTIEKFNFASHFLKDGGDIIVLKDEQQNLYHHGFDFNPTVKMTLDKNFRNSYEVIQFTDALLSMQYKQKSEALSFGLTPTVSTYSGEAGFVATLIKEIDRYLSHNYRLEDMVVLVGCGVDKSWLMKQKQIGNWKIKRFTSEYSEDGEQIYTEGELLVDSVYRFKGRQKPIVLFTEVDFNKWSEHVKRLLYTGCTRAQVSLSLLMTEQAEQTYIAHRQPNIEEVFS